jgi:hypothetical protein
MLALVLKVIQYVKTHDEFATILVALIDLIESQPNTVPVPKTPIGSTSTPAP